MSATRADAAIWRAAVNAALLGTDRAPFTLPPIDGTLGAACTVLARDEADASAALLRVAAATSAYRRCGWIPACTSEPLPEPCPPDERPACSPAAAAILRRILQGEHTSLLATWLTLAGRHGVRAPADTLHELLDLGGRAPALRPLVRTAGGTRAAWLASFNDEWSYAITGNTVDALVAIWEAGAGPARVAALQQLRALDAERARVVLEASWAQETPTDRPGFLAVLEHALSLADEPFLARALDDKRKDVRQQAATLLARLPGSALALRMTQRATRLLTLGTTLLRRPRLEVVLPEEADAAMIRDGVSPKPPAGTGVGEKAWWLAQIVGAVPPSAWTAAWSLEADTIVRAVADHEWREPLVAGWLTAAERYRDAGWARALWENEVIARIEPKWGAPPLEHVFTRVVPADQVDTELRQAIAGGRDVLRGAHCVLIAILGWPNAWSDPLARAIARRLKEYAGSDRVPLDGEFGLKALVERCGQAAPVSATDAFLDGWPEHSDAWPTWASAVDALTSVLHFRQDLHLAFTEESSA